MSAKFVGASTQYLKNSTVSGLIGAGGYPCTVALWLNLAAVGTVHRRLWALVDTATNNEYLSLNMTNLEKLSATSTTGAVTELAVLATAITAGSWNWLIGRFISSTNRRVAALYDTGLIEHAQNTVASSPTGLDSTTIGALLGTLALNPWDGMIAEYWLTNTDIQPDGAQLDDNLLRQLAYGGPFSVPHIANDIIEYRSFRKSIESDQDEVGENYWGGAGRQVWTNTNGVTRGPHPPLPGWYRRPNDIWTRMPKMIGMTFAPQGGGPGIVTEQEGFRWRNDDGGEASATWAAAQDQPLTVAAGENVRLRFLVHKH